MSQRGESLNPRARRDGLVIEDLPDEVLVYDLESHQAHCLNRTAALVWRACDGRTSVRQMSARVGRELGIAGDDDLVWVALDQLGRKNLLMGEVTRQAHVGRVSRRSLMVKLGLAALSVPLLTTIDSPAAAVAATLPCISGGSCSSATAVLCQPCRVPGQDACDGTKVCQTQGSGRTCADKSGSGCP